MSQIKIQDYIKEEIKVNHLAGLKKGQTIAARDERSEKNWVGKLVERGYGEQDAAVIFKDARDMAILELQSQDESAFAEALGPCGK
jgi:hypothetical protein